jgi:hypothetical protein
VGGFFGRGKRKSTHTQIGAGVSLVPCGIPPPTALA